MQITTFFTTAAIFIASAAAQSATATGSAPTSTSTSSGGDLNSIVSQVPQCALTCLDSTATSIGCSASDLTCLCSKSDQLISSIGPCILLQSQCSSEEQSQIQSVAGNLCSDVSSADSAELASASNAINSALATGTTGTGTAAASSTATSASGNAAARADSPLAGVGVMGAAAALAVLAL
ncbi:hypothetical protein LA080_005385 [Diaporthe eres]|uniref:CFEM domain-containing protein n=1 Tax=Diaporthe vaccinii TaxID=105482 RepID=A0ABR4EA26_9PEZI|nr:hypothetical protein LA080_005385 [Diaporthe eres]